MDYLTYQFEGGADLALTSTVNVTDTIPIKVTYTPPGDFGWVVMQMTPTGDTLFSGGIIWMGKGAIDFPKSFQPVSGFAITSPGNQATASTYAPIDFDANFKGQIPDLAKTWTAIGNLKVVADHLATGRKIRVFLYTPSVGTGDPADWDWIFMVCS